eukprot:tig00000711_g3370.t1
MGLFGKSKKAAGSEADVEAPASPAEESVPSVPAARLMGRAASTAAGGAPAAGEGAEKTKKAGRLRSALASMVAVQEAKPEGAEAEAAPAEDPEAKKREEEFRAKVKEEFERMMNSSVFRVEKHYEKAVESMEKLVQEKLAGRGAASAAPAPPVPEGAVPPASAAGAIPAAAAPLPSNRVIGARHSITAKV